MQHLIALSLQRLTLPGLLSWPAWDEGRGVTLASAWPSAFRTLSLPLWGRVVVAAVVQEDGAPGRWGGHRGRPGCCQPQGLCSLLAAREPSPPPASLRPAAGLNTSLPTKGQDLEQQYGPIVS